MRVIGYTILTSNVTRDLARGVREHINDGWQPLGGVAIDTDANGEFLMAQALVKYEAPSTVD
jgi:hypothetical protein